MKSTGQYLLSAKAITHQFDAIGTLVVILHEDGSINIGCSNLNLNDIERMLEYTKLKALEQY